MEDNKQGLKNRTPFETRQRVSTLSPILETWAGPQYQYGPFDDTQLPDNSVGFCPEHEEVPDDTFRSWPEKE